jgi:hypothetical protein
VQRAAIIPGAFFAEDFKNGSGVQFTVQYRIYEPAGGGFAYKRITIIQGGLEKRGRPGRIGKHKRLVKRPVLWFSATGNKAYKKIGKKA